MLPGDACTPPKLTNMPPTQPLRGWAGPSRASPPRVIRSPRGPFQPSATSPGSQVPGTIGILGPPPNSSPANVVKLAASTTVSCLACPRTQAFRHPDPRRPSTRLAPHPPACPSPGRPRHPYPYTHRRARAASGADAAAARACPPPGAAAAAANAAASGSGAFFLVLALALVLIPRAEPNAREGRQRTGRRKPRRRLPAGGGGGAAPLATVLGAGAGAGAVAETVASPARRPVGAVANDRQYPGRRRDGGQRGRDGNRGRLNGSQAGQPREATY